MVVLIKRFPPLGLVAAIVALQAFAAVYFLIDGVGDALGATSGMTALEAAGESAVALSLLCGVGLGLFGLRAAASESRGKDDALSLARGELAQAVERQFAQWRLTPAEADVALFALKGCTVEEIARLRGSAAGTVRAQLSQIYAKASVNSQAGLMATVLEDLLPR